MCDFIMTIDEPNFANMRSGFYSHEYVPTLLPVDTEGNIAAMHEVVADDMPFSNVVGYVVFSLFISI